MPLNRWKIFPGVLLNFHSKWKMAARSRQTEDFNSFVASRRSELSQREVRRDSTIILWKKPSPTADEEAGEGEEEDEAEERFCPRHRTVNSSKHDAR